MTDKPEKLTLGLGIRERERLQQLAAWLGIKAKRGPGAGISGSVSGLIEALDEAYAANNARVLTLLARMLQDERPDVFGYWIAGNQQYLVQWTADPRNDGTPRMLPHTSTLKFLDTNNQTDQYIVPDVVTDEDIAWLRSGGIDVQREDTHNLALLY